MSLLAVFLDPELTLKWHIITLSKHSELLWTDIQKK